MNRTYLYSLLTLLILLPQVTLAETIKSVGEYVKKGEFKKALSHIQELSKTNSSVELKELEAQCHYQLGDYPEAEKVLRQLSESKDLTATQKMECRLRLARTLALQEILTEAATIVESVLKDFPGPAAQETAGFIYLKSHRYQDAIIPLKAWVEAQPEYRGHLALGIALSKTGEVSPAIKHLTEALNHSTTRQEARFELALLHSQHGNPKSSLSFLLDYFEENPFERRCVFQASRQLIKLRRSRMSAHAMKLFEYLRKVFGESSRALHLQAQGRSYELFLKRARNWEQLGELDRALRELNTSIRRWPSTELHFIRAEFWARHGVFAEAIAELKAIPEDETESVQDKVEDRLREFTEAQENLPVWLKKIGKTRWKDVEPALNDALIEAGRLGKKKESETLSRLLLARNPKSVMALRLLVQNTRAPELFPMHIYFLSRLAQAEPDDASHATNLKRIRLALMGR